MKLAILILLGALSAVSCREVFCGCQPGPQLVCASNYVTYLSLCHMKCGDFERTRHLLHYGACQPLLCGCLPVKEPVCASDGKTYQNECEMNCNNFENARQFVHFGPCKITRFYLDY